MSDRPLTPTATPGIYKREGRYVVRFRDSRGKQHKRFAKTLAEARTIRAANVADVARGEFRELSRVPFEDYAREWLDTYQGRTSRGLRDVTRREYRRAIEKRAIPFFGRTKLAEITPRDVKRYVAAVAAEGVSPNTVRLAVAPVRALFATAVEEDAIRSNPAAGVRVAQVSPDTEDVEKAKALTEDEVRRLLVAVAPDWRLLVEFLLHTGLRISEAVALRWQDVDLGTRRVLVRRRYYGGAFGPPKSKYGRRDVPISAELARRLWELRKQRRAQDGAYVFPGEGERPLAASTAFRAVQAAGKRAGVPWVGLHTLRHTAATVLFANGWNAKQVQRFLGQHKASFTLDTYIHLLSDELPETPFLDALTAADHERSDEAENRQLEHGAEA